MPTEEKYYEADGVRMHYCVAGQGQPLVFLHGFGVTIRQYPGLLDRLAKKYRIIAPDLPGFGKSGNPPEAWSINDYGNLIAKFIKDLKLRQPVVVGQSFGGGVALAAASVMPDISRLILISPAGIPPKLSLFKLIFITVIVKPFHEIRYYRQYCHVASYLSSGFFNLLGRIRCIPKMAKITAKASNEEMKIGKVLPADILMIMAQKDEYFPLPLQQEFADKIGGCRVKVMDEYHDWPLFKPELLIQELT